MSISDTPANGRAQTVKRVFSRVYALVRKANGGTRFTMTETIGGPIFPLFARMIPPFDESFNQFAADLKAAAEEKS